MTATRTAVDPAPPARGADGLPAPYGGGVCDPVVNERAAAVLADQLRKAPAWTLTPRQRCDLELLLSGGFAPLDGFMDAVEERAVCRTMRLPSGRLWPLPIVLDVDAATAAQADDARARLGDAALVALRDADGTLLAGLRVRDVWRRAPLEIAAASCGTDDPHHPWIAHAAAAADARPWGIGGPVVGLRLPPPPHPADLRLTPHALRTQLIRRGWQHAIAFQTRNPLHGAHLALIERARAEVAAATASASPADVGVVLHPVVGPTQPGDLDVLTRVRCYRAVMPRLGETLTVLALLPLAMRMAGPREALLHAIVRRNHGCSHLIIGRDHASPPPRPDGTPFYPTDAAQQLLMRHADEIGVTPVALPHMAYVETIDGPDAPAADRAGAAARIRGGFQPRDAAPAGARVHALSGRALRQRLADGAPIPPWFTPPEVAAVLRRRFPPRHARGFAVLLTGLSGAGKSTLARALKAQLEADDDPRSIHLLDGDAVRRMLSSELGFSAAHRDLNVRRIGFVAAEIVRAGGIALCAPIAPYDAARRAVRQMIEAVGGFALVHVATPLAVCETRDPKGLYRQARAGAIARFTGVSDPYEPPRDAEIVVDAGACTPEAAAERVRAYLRRGGYFPE